AGVAVISYDRMITGTDQLSAYITFDSWYQGQLQGQYIVDQLEAKYGEVKGNVVILHGDPGDSCAPLYYGGAYEMLAPYVESGAINIISDNDCIGWSPAEATKHVENAMSIADAQGLVIDAVLSPNDGLASGAIAALGDDIAMETIITGMDCEVAACQRVLAGTQSMTVFGDSREMGRVAIDVAVELATTGTCTTQGTMEGSDADGNPIDVPAVLVTCEFVDANNMNIVTDSGYHTEAEIYG
ncbi:MAG: substrate-binding domain-containing protein, partial [Clostridia bacterium]|nr:substrate-binding domain-containing protein [Clostridia bacterium]